MSIDYERMQKSGPKLKAALTRANRTADNVRYVRVLVACQAAVKEWEAIGAWPDNWSLWQRTLEDAALVSERANRQHIVVPRLEDLV